MKKLIITLLVLLMCFPIISVASGGDGSNIKVNIFIDQDVEETQESPTAQGNNDYTEEEQAEQLKALGLFKGSDKGFELENELTRAQGAVMITRLLGKEEEAIKEKIPHPFSDVPIWASPHVGYLYKNGLTSGISKTQFGSDNKMTASQYTTFLLRSLGYDDSKGDFRWDQALEYAKKINMVTDEIADKLETNKFIRGSMVNLSYKALKTKQKSSEESLVQKLINQKAISEISAKKYKFIGTPLDNMANKNGDQEDDLTPVNIEDGNLEELVRDMINKPRGVLTILNVKDISIIRGEDRDISSLEGLQYFTNLVGLYLGENQIDDLTPIESIETLRSVDISDNQISSIAPLTVLPNLRSLDLSDNPIEDINLIEQIDSIRELDLSRLGLDDISFLENLTNIRRLNLERNNIEDIDALNGMNHLMELSLYNNNISDIEALRNKPRLMGLTVKGNAELDDISSLESKPLMIGLSFANCSVENIDVVANMPLLQELYMNGNNISNINPVRGLQNLELLYLEGNPINDFSPVENIYDNLDYVDFSLDNEVIIEFEDPVLDTYIRERTNISESTITLRDVANIKTLNIEDTALASLEGIQHLTGLEKLELLNNEITDISPLSSLTNLEELNLYGNHITDVTPLSSLENLIDLNISYNPIRNHEELSQLITLESLSIESTDYYEEPSEIVRNVSFISPLVNLKDLNISVNYIDDISGLSTLSQLEILNASSNNIIDIDPLENLNNLIDINLEENYISDLEPLSRLTDLVFLDLRNNNISNIEDLESLHKLRQLKLAGNDIEDYLPIAEYFENLENPDFTIPSVVYNDVSDFNIIVAIPDENLEQKIREEINKPDGEINDEDMESITKLVIDSSNIRSLEGLQYATNLEILHASYNNIEDITQLSQLAKLKYLHLKDNNISSIVPLSELKNLERLYLTSNEVKHLTPLKKLSKMTYLYLYGNNISDISSLSNLRNLTILNLAYNNITDIEALRNLTNLEDLFLNGNDIDDYSPVEGYYDNLRNPDFRILLTIEPVKPIDNDINDSVLPKKKKKY